jgi:hypothetical protein
LGNRIDTWSSGPKVMEQRARIDAGRRKMTPSRQLAITRCHNQR